jgi:hypothetical protein
MNPRTSPTLYKLHLICSCILCVVLVAGFFVAGGWFASTGQTLLMIPFSLAIGSFGYVWKYPTDWDRNPRARNGYFIR